MKKRLLALTLCLLLVVGVFAACAKTENGGETTTAAGGGATTTAAPTGPYATTPGELPITTEVGMKMTLGFQQSARITDYEDNYMTNLALEETGVDIDFVLLPSDQPTQKWELMVAANEELPDMLSLAFADAATANYGKNGVFVPLEGYFDTLSYFFKEADISDANREAYFIYSTSPDGHIYSYASHADGLGDRIRFHTAINRTWLEALGLEMPETTDEFYDALVAFRDQDPNGNGSKDEIPYLPTGWWNGQNWYELINSFTYYHPDYKYNITDGKIWSPVITEEFREGIRYVNKLVEEGLIPEAAFSMTTDESKAAINHMPDQDIIVGAYGGLASTIFEASNETVYNYDAIAKPLVGPNGVAWCPNRIPQYNMYAHITKDCEYPEIAFRFFDYWAQEKQSIIERYGEPGVHFDYRLDDPEGFASKYPYAGSNAKALGLEGVYCQIPGVNNPWTSTDPHNSGWQMYFCNVLSLNVFNNSASETPPPETWTDAKELYNNTGTHRTWLSIQFNSNRRDVTPDEVVTKLMYTEEENNAMAEMQTSVDTYIDESFANFCVGTLDIEKDWDTFVSTLESMGLPTLIEYAQAAYDRMYK